MNGYTKFVNVNDLQSKKGFSGGSDGKESVGNAGDLDPIPGSGRFPGEGNGNPLQYSCLENLMEREVWWAIVHGIAKSQTRLKRLSTAQVVKIHM